MSEQIPKLRKKGAAKALTKKITEFRKTPLFQNVFLKELKKIMKELILKRRVLNQIMTIRHEVSNFESGTYSGRQSVRLL